MREYEIMLIVPAEADDKVIGGATDRIGQVVTRSGGEVTKIDRWGRRRFSYEIDKASEGFYLVVEFTADPADVKELGRVLTLADDVIRFKTMVLPEKRARAGDRPAYQPRTEAAATPAAPAAVEPAEAEEAEEAGTVPSPEGSEPESGDEAEEAGVETEVEPVEAEQVSAPASAGSQGSA
jgi:small subunit ribosomal protein S6